MDRIQTLFLLMRQHSKLKLEGKAAIRGPAPASHPHAANQNLDGGTASRLRNAKYVCIVKSSPRPCLLLDGILRLYPLLLHLP